MAQQYPIISASSNGRVIQFILEDATNNKNLNVQHHVNLNANQDAVLGKIIIVDKAQVGNAPFASECALYGVVPQANTDILVVFRYDFLNVARDYQMVKTFPAAGYYTVPGKPKVIATSVGDADTSKTGGEAL
jgi:hypothetical protein